MSATKLRITLAFAGGLLLVGWAFYTNQQPTQTATGGISVTEPKLISRKHIPVTDSDLDGVPDWQAALVTGDPIYIDASSTEAYVPPDTLTGQFVYRFNQDVATLDLYGMLEENRESLIEAAVKELERETMEKIYDESELPNIISTTNRDTIKFYGNIVGGTFYAFLTSPENEYEVFVRLTEEGNPKHIEKLKVIEQEYTDQIDYLVNMEVPEQYVFEHLSIVNALSAMRQNTYGMTLLYDDPYYTAARYRRFVEDFLVLKRSVRALYDALYLDERITFAETDALRVLVEEMQ